MISHRTNFYNYVAQTSDGPMDLEIKKAEGVYLKTTTGKRYIDLISGIGVSNLGHRNHGVLQAIRKQLGKYLHTMVYGEYVLSPQVKLAQHLTKELGGNLTSTFFVNSGSEAIEGAIKLAKRYTGRSGLVAMKNAYHGSSAGALSLMSDEYYSGPFHPLLPNVDFATFNAIDSLSIITKDTAAVFVEMVQGEAGYIAPKQDFLNAVQKRCHETGALLVVDEIQTGMGRTGALFAHQKYQVQPDILCLAKAFGGGMPLGAFVAKKEVMDSFTHDPVLGHISTFGGHPVCCAASLETFKQLKKGRYIEQVPEKEQLFRALLDHPQISKITGTGLMLGLQLESGEAVQKVIAHCLERGVIIDWFLYADDKLRVAPPLIINHNQIKQVCKVLREGLDKL